MSRILVTALFAFFAAATARTAWHSGATAWDEPTVAQIALAGYSFLRLGVIVAFTAFVAIRSRPARPSREPVAFVACAAAMLALVLLQRPDGSTETFAVVAGDLVALVCAGWLLVSVLALGRCFGILPEARGLVTRGPYGIVRHPVYLGELGMTAGLSIAAMRGWNLAILVLFASAQAVRMRLEEAALAKEFLEYESYARRTPRLIPRIWSRQPAVPRTPLGAEAP